MMKFGMVELFAFNCKRAEMKDSIYILNADYPPKELEPTETEENGNDEQEDIELEPKPSPPVRDEIKSRQPLC